MHGLRVARSLFLLSVPLYIWIAEKNAPVGKFLHPRSRIAIYLVCLVLVLTMFRIRRRELNRVEDQLSRVGVDPAVTRRWRAIQLLLLGCSEGIVLRGCDSISRWDFRSGFSAVRGGLPAPALFRSSRGRHRTEPLICTAEPIAGRSSQA